MAAARRRESESTRSGVLSLSTFPNDGPAVGRIDTPGLAHRFSLWARSAASRATRTGSARSGSGLQRAPRWGEPGLASSPHADPRVDLARDPWHFDVPPGALRPFPFFRVREDLFELSFHHPNGGNILGSYPVGATLNHANLIKLTSGGAHLLTRYLGASGPVNGDTHNLAVHTDGTIYVADSLCAVIRRAARSFFICSLHPKLPLHLAVCMPRWAVATEPRAKHEVRVVIRCACGNLSNCRCWRTPIWSYWTCAAGDRCARLGKAWHLVARDAKRTILLVDDSKTIVHVLQTYLVGNDFEYIVRSDGKQGLAAARLHRPALIISDLKMPGLDGLELTKAVRMSSTISKTPIVLVSSTKDEKTCAQLLACGANAYLSKPLDPTQLNDVVQSLLT